MKNEERNSVLSETELDAALKQMAEEVPPMPADFRDRWMSAVRSEAAKADREPEKEKTPSGTVSLLRWTRILSVAAAFVFLIGGTLLYRNSKQSLSVLYTAENREAAESAAEPVPAGDAGEDPAAAMGAEAPVQAAADAEEDFAENAVKGDEMVLNAFAAVPKNAESPARTDQAEEEADYAMEEAEAGYDAVYEEAAEEPAPTEAPTPELTAEPAAAPEPAEEPEAKAGFLPAVGAFFADMGDFLLAALPYLLVLAVPAGAALVIRRKKSR